MKSLDLVSTSKEIDPVCGMTVDPEHAAAAVQHGDRTFRFCSKSCAAKFQANPDKYLGGATEPHDATPAPKGTLYTCPMHPEVQQDHPGSCPKCGMALEPMAAGARRGAESGAGRHVAPILDRASC